MAWRGAVVLLCLVGGSAWADPAPWVVQRTGHAVPGDTASPGSRYECLINAEGCKAITLERCRGARIEMDGDRLSADAGAAEAMPQTCVVSPGAASVANCNDVLLSPFSDEGTTGVSLNVAGVVRVDQRAPPGEGEEPVLVLVCGL